MMSSSRREMSIEHDEYDPYEVALARLDSIQSEYLKKQQDAWATFESNRIARQEDIQERQRQLQLLQEELQRKQNELKDMEQELQDEKKKFHDLLKQEKQERKRKLEPYLRVSPAPINQGEGDRELTDVARGRTETTSPKQKDNKIGLLLSDPIVIDSEDVSSDEWEHPLATSSVSPSKRPRISEVGGTNVNPSSTQPNQKRQRVRSGNPSEGGECSNTAQISNGRNKEREAVIVRKRVQRKRKNRTIFRGITDPIVGEIYKIHQGPLRGEYAAVLLPVGSFNVIGISKSIHETPLTRYIPPCYIYNTSNKEILGWETDYDDGGPKVTDRKFPVMSFKGIRWDRVELEGEFSPVGATYAWVPAKSLRTFDFNAPMSSMMPGYLSAKRFKARLNLITENRNRQAHDDNESSFAPSMELDGSTSQTSGTGERDTGGSQTQGHLQVLTLRYSEASQTSHQSPPIEDHDSIPQNITEPVFHSFESIYRETSSEASPDSTPDEDIPNHELIRNLFAEPPAEKIGETSNNNASDDDVGDSDVVESPRAPTEAQLTATAELPYVARAIRRPWTEDASDRPNDQDGSSAQELEPASPKTVTPYYANLRRYVNQNESETENYSPTSSRTLSQGTVQDIPRNDDSAPPPTNPHIQNTASTALSYFNAIYNRRQ
ncbi:uncharacterized protein F4812DRAFT_440968 [Daldinia caldariorum]|uniref:uncharacterized protein n=1 Tax=Daldinia caldariorum TaxID=326644 RepID=UPI002008C164|nr:uncharacterized protein F4812DRAFT_440968 [Daldinia caldariorum]KAI1464921.1 hypothetical protein F4812DRAFT_440968 [Daldinia caldariorum]